MKKRIEEDSFGKLFVPKDKMWGIQTQRSLENFPIGIEKMPLELIHAYTIIKKGAAKSNGQLGYLEAKKSKLIEEVCDEILNNKWNDNFPLSIWQTGSGTQTNMNINEVIKNIGNEKVGKEFLHANDDINMGQSSNDTFETAIRIAATIEIEHNLFPVLKKVEKTLNALEKRYKNTLKLGRTHLQDAIPLSFGQEISGWREMISQNINMIENTIPFLKELPLGGTAIGTGLNTHPQFAKITVNHISEWSATNFVESKNKFHGLTSKDAILNTHSSLKTLAVNVMKIANDIRWLASGPHGGLGEITIPSNEPGSSIMPGKINPTQIEALTMICVQVMGNDTAITIAASQGNFQLNVYMPLIAHNLLQSIKLLSQGLNSFNDRCLIGLRANDQKMLSTVKRSLALVTALSPHIGYENASMIAQKAKKENLTLREAAIESKLINIDEFDKYIDLYKMI